LDTVVEELPLRDCRKFWGRRASRLAPSVTADDYFDKLISIRELLEGEK